MSLFESESLRFAGLKIPRYYYIKRLLYLEGGNLQGVVYGHSKYIAYSCFCN